MVVRDYVKPQWLHIPLAAAGFLIIFGTVIVVLVAAITLIQAAFLLLLGASIRGLIETLSVSRIVAGLSGDLFAWIAGTLLFIALIPVFVRYNDWLGRLLYDRDSDTDSAR